MTDTNINLAKYCSYITIYLANHCDNVTSSNSLYLHHPVKKGFHTPQTQCHSSECCSFVRCLQYLTTKSNRKKRTKEKKILSFQKSKAIRWSSSKFKYHNQNSPIRYNVNLVSAIFVGTLQYSYPVCDTCPNSLDTSMFRECVHF